MRWDLISINWTAQALSSEQLLVLRNVAAMVLKEGIKLAEVDFTHELVEGRLTRKSSGTFVAFAGTFFHAHLGKVRGEDWTVDFLIPKGSEYITIDEKSVVISSRPLAGKEFETQVVNHGLAKTGRESVLTTRAMH